MNFDLRLPIGIIFSIFGVLLAGYGLVGAPAYNARSLGINMNLDWGLVLLAFGLFMLFLAVRAIRRNRP